MLASELVTGIRRDISDEKSPYRHADAEILSFVGDALIALWSMHPEAFYVDDIILDAPDSPASTTTVVTLDPIYKPAVIHHAVSKLYLQDAEDLNNQALSDKHWELFKAEV